MDPVVIGIGLVVVILITLLLKKLDSSPAFQRIGASITYFLVLALLWQILMLIFTEAIKKWLLSIVCGGSFLLFLVWLFKPFKARTQKIALIALAVIVVISVVLAVII